MKTVIVQKMLLEDLKRDINSYNEKAINKLKLDVAVYFISLMISLPTFYRGDKGADSFARLSSKKMRKLNYNYSDYLKFLLKYGYVEKKNYSTDKKTCNAYRIKDDYLGEEVVSYELTDKFLLNKFNEFGQTQYQVEKMEIATLLRPHLVGSFHDLLSIDSKEAYNEIVDFRRSDPYKYLSGSQLLKEWHKKEWNYSIKSETDNRLHTTLTRTNRVLRKYINYNGESLGAADIKTSQPYFLLAILKGIIEKDKIYLQRIGALDIIEDELINGLFELDICIENARQFADFILNHDLYEELIDLIPIKYEDGKPFRMVWPNSEIGVPKVPKFYDSERDLIKEVVLEVLNGSVKSKKTEVVAFKKLFPCVDKILKCLDEGGVQVCRLLSHVEAYCLLDVVAMHISEEYKEIPLFSIHDSLITTQKHLEVLAEETVCALEQLTGLKPNLKIEYWRSTKTLTY